MYNLDEILIQSVKVRDSDIHLTTGRPPSYRIDGVLAPIEGERLTPQMLEDILMPLMDVRHREELQNNGQTDFAYAISGVGRFRVNVFKQRGTLASVMRSLPFNIPEPEQLGIPAEVVEMTSRKRGLILVTGPTGSGKSTTLASLLHVINRTYPYHIITLEDLIEYLHRHDKSVVNQREIGSDSTDYADEIKLFVNAMIAAANVAAVDPDVNFVKSLNSTTERENVRYYMTDQRKWNSTDASEGNVLEKDASFYFNVKDYIWLIWISIQIMNRT